MSTLDGKVMGKHDGLMYYTIGQRQGLGIGGEGEPWFVVGKDVESNTLFVEQGFDHPAMTSTALIANQVSWTSSTPKTGTFDCTAKFRYRQADVPVTVEVNEDEIKVTFKDTARAVTPGQSVVLYDGDECLGGATIDRIYRDGEIITYLG